MKICPKCHTRYDDSQNFCIKCGTKLIPEENETEAKAPSEKTEKKSFSDRNTDIPKFERKSRKPFATVIVAVAVAVLCVVGFIVHANMTGSSGGTAQSPRPVVSSSKTARTVNEEETDNTAEETYKTTSEEEPIVYDTPSSGYDTASDDYIIPGSDSRYITESEISSLNADQLRLARNEIFARHGRKFDSEYLQNYFNSKDWYTPSIESDDFDYDTMLNSYEKANIDVIKKAESKFSSDNDTQTTDDGEQTFLQSIQGQWYSGGHDVDGSNRFVADIENRQITFTYSDGSEGTDDISDIGQDSDGYYIVTSWGNCYQLSEDGETLSLFFDADYPNKDNYSGTDSLYREKE